MAEKKKAGGDAPSEKKGKVKEEPEEPEEIFKTPSQIALEEAEYRAMLRRQRFIRRWPEITKVEIKTRKWRPPGPPKRMPQIIIEKPEMKFHKWIPPYRRKRRPRPKLCRVQPEEINQPLYECAKLKKVYFKFVPVDKNKMMLQGSVGCNSKRYSSTTCGSQTACIAVVCQALLEEKSASQLRHQDVDGIIEAGDRYYKQCMLALKCYKGKPQLQLNQLLISFFIGDTKYTVKMSEIEKGFLAKHPDNIQTQPDLMQLMDKRVGSTFSFILTVGDKHFLIWGNPPAPESGSQAKTICYIFDPHMLDEFGKPNPVKGAGAFLRYAGVNSFVVDFLANYGDLDSAKKGTPKPPIVLTKIEVVQKEHLDREARYDLDLKALKLHCRDEWENYYKNSLIDKKLKEGEYPLCSLSAVSVATSRATSRKKVNSFYQKSPKEAPPTLPVAPERAPAALTHDQIMQMRGEDFFLYCPKTDAHTFGRDDILPRPKSETILHSYVEVADTNFHSQYVQMDVEKWILRGTRHMASYRYQTFKTFTAIPCCISALAMLRRLRARGWNEDIVDETLDCGYNLYRESLVERGGPIRPLVYGELKDNFRIRDREYFHKGRGIAVWGKLISSNPKVFDLCRGIEAFFKESDAGILQIPGEYETAIWNEGGKYYVYHPWPADKYGNKVGLQDGGKACLLLFTRVSRLCEHFFESVPNLKRKPFSITDISVVERENMPEPVNKLKPVAPNRWIVRGTFHEGDDRFPENHRFKQATPTSIAAIAMSHIVDPAGWNPEDIDECLIRGDILYQNTMEHLEKMGISLDTPRMDEEVDEEEDIPAGTLAAADVMNRFRVSEYDCIETDVVDSAYSGKLHPEPGSDVVSLKDSLAHMMKEYSHAVVTARGGSMAVWKQDNHLYFFDPHGCDENGYPSEEPRAAACLVRIKGGVDELAKVIESNLAPGSDDNFNISPVSVTATKLNTALGAPETNLDNKAFQWISKGTAAILPGPRGENTALGKAAEKVGIGNEDMAGRTIALPAAAAFAAATVSVPPPHMHRDHMYNFLDAGADYYLNHVKKTGRKEILPEDLTEKFEMGANTFSIELGEAIRLPFRLPDVSTEGEEEGGGGDMGNEEVEAEEKEEPMKQIKDALFKMWYDETKPSHTTLLVGDYHQLGVWLAPGGKVVAFDPAPTLGKGMLTAHRIKKGDELRLQRIKDEMAGEGGGDEPDEEDEELGGEGEEKEPEPDFVPPDSTPALIVCATPGELMDKLALQGGLDTKQCLAPYKLYPVTITNELTSVLKEKKGGGKGEGDEAAGDEEDEDALVEAIDDEAMGKYFMRIGRAIASVRGRVAQSENYFMDPNRDYQDAANCVMGIVIEHIEPYVHWKSQLIDAALKYGDRLYTLSLPNATAAPRMRAAEVTPEFHVTTFNVKLEMEDNAVTGDIKAGDSGRVLNLKQGINRFFESHKHGVICCKDYCVAVWKASDDKSFCLWEPHSVGPAGRTSPGGGAGLILISNVDDLAECIKSNIEKTGRAGSNKYCMTGVKVFWEFSKSPGPVSPQGAVPDEGYEWKVLTGYVETAKGRTILRGTRPPDIVKFTRDAVLQSSCAAIVAACMSHARRPPLWTRRTVDEVMATGCQLFTASLGALGYEFRPGEDLLLPLQVLKRFILGVNYVRYDLQQVFTGKLEQTHPTEMSVRCALERFFESHTHGILWSAPHAVAVWRVVGAPSFYMMEPHACGPTGLRIDGQDNGAACVLTFTSPKLMAFGYLQNVPVVERAKQNFQLYAMSVVVSPIKKMGGVDPPLVRAPPGTKIKLVPATSKVTVDGKRRHADEKDRKHPPGSESCLDAQRASEKRDKEQKLLKGLRNTSGWLVLADGTQFLSAMHSMSCRKFTPASRGYQALACSVMAVAMTRVEDVCRWCGATLDQILESGDQLYQDSYLHYKPKNARILAIEQILRKFYTPGNCVCRVVVYKARQNGVVDTDLVEKLKEFFREEKAGVFVAGVGDFAVALFRTPKGYYMFDPADRDRYGRAVAPPCKGRARACLSQYPNIQTLAQKLGSNIPPVMKIDDSGSNEVKTLLEPSSAQKTSQDKMEGKSSSKDQLEVHFTESPSFAIYGMDVTSLRRLNRFER